MKAKVGQKEVRKGGRDRVRTLVVYWAAARWGVTTAAVYEALRGVDTRLGKEIREGCERKYKEIKRVLER